MCRRTHLVSFSWRRLFYTDRATTPPSGGSGGILGDTGEPATAHQNRSGSLVKDQGGGGVSDTVKGDKRLEERLGGVYARACVRWCASIWVCARAGACVRGCVYTRACGRVGVTHTQTHHGAKLGAAWSPPATTPPPPASRDVPRSGKPAPLWAGPRGWGPRRRGGQLRSPPRSAGPRPPRARNGGTAAGAEGAPNE